MSSQVTEHELRVQMAEARLEMSRLRRDAKIREAARLQDIKAAAHGAVSGQDLDDAETAAALAVETWKIRAAELDLAKMGVKLEG